MKSIGIRDEASDMTREVSLALTWRFGMSLDIRHFS